VGYDHVSIDEELLTFQKKLLPPYSGSRLGPEDGSNKLLQHMGTIYQLIHCPNPQDLSSHITNKIF